MKLGLYSITYLGLWYRGEPLSLPDMIMRAKEYGYDGIEIDGKRPHGNPLDWPTGRCRELRSMADAEGIEVPLTDLKAVFFVRSFEGDPGHDESKDLYQPRPPATRKVSVRFQDGEELVGHTRQLDRHRTGLFFTPLDPRSNNLRVFAPFAALAGVQRLL